MRRARIVGTGSYVPPAVVKNDDLKQFLDVSDEWIFARTGVKERRYAEVGVYTSELALEASRQAIQDAGYQPKDVECIIFATISPDHHFPGTAVHLQTKLGIADKYCACYDIRQEGSGFVHGTEMARAFIEAGVYRNVLVVGAEICSHMLDFSDRSREITVLFGDGAGAALFQETDTEKADEGVFHTEMHADSSGASDGFHTTVFDISHKPSIDYDPKDVNSFASLYPQMPNGHSHFVNGVNRMAEVTLSALQKNGLTLHDVDWVLPHQANGNMNNEMADRINLPSEKMLMNIHKYGNTSAAAIPLLLNENIRNGQIKRGDLLLFVAFGSGFTWGAALGRY